MKIAVDFVSPEGLEQNHIMSQALRRCSHNLQEAPQDRMYQDKLQAGLMNMAAAVKHMRVLHPELCQSAVQSSVQVEQTAKKKRARPTGSQRLNGSKGASSGSRKEPRQTIDEAAPPSDLLPPPQLPPPPQEEQEAIDPSGPRRNSQVPTKKTWPDLLKKKLAGS